MRVVVAPDSFKGTLGAHDVARAIAEGWASVRPSDELVVLPQADGGEGSLEAVERSVPGAVRRSAGRVTGPDGRPVDGVWLELPDGTAVVELALSSGLPLMREPDPRGATTRGLGEVIAAAVAAGATSVVVALGGSASTDGAAGALRALGLSLLDSDGIELADGGADLARLARADASRLVPAPAGGAILLTDVTAPLLGEHGAAAVFGPQKGAGPDDVRDLDAALARFHEVVGGDAAAPGAGAAGGSGFGLAAMWGARIVPGARYLAGLTGADGALEGADLLITGEGSFDGQSLTGKVVGTLVELAGEHAVPVHVIAGRVALETDLATTSLTDLAGSADAAMTATAHWVREAAAAAARRLG